MDGNKQRRLLNSLSIQLARGFNGLIAINVITFSTHLLYTPPPYTLFSLYLFADDDRGKKDESAQKRTGK